MKKIFFCLLMISVLLAVSSCRADGQKIAVATVCTEHTFGEWSEVIAPTTRFEGLKQRFCKACGFLESKKIPSQKVSFYQTENGNKILEVQNPQDLTDTQQNQAANDEGAIKITVNEVEKTVTVEGAALGTGTDMDGIRATVEKILEENEITVAPDFSFDIQIPEDEEDPPLVPAPW